MIRFENVTKTFPTGTTALQNVTFKIEPGELVVMTGPSGSGKTTILKLLLRELLPTAGTIVVNNFTVTDLKNRDLPKLRRTVGAVFQDFKLFEDRTVAENISAVLEIANQPDQDIARRIDEVLILVDLQDKRGLFPRQLSGGELQRVAIARAIALKPKILFADEPTGNLDEDTSLGIAKLLGEIHNMDSTVVIATHDPAMIKTLPARRLKIAKGILEA